MIKGVKDNHFSLKIVLYFILFFQVILNWAIDPTKSITQYIHDVWKTEQGLPQNSLQAIIQSHEGYLWLGTQEGIVRFDGVRFDVFDKNRIKALKDNYILSLYEDKTGALWVGTRGGGLTYIHFQDDKFLNYNTSNGLASNFVYAITMDGKGTLWLGTTGGLTSLKDDRFTTFTSKEGLADNLVYTICIDSKDELWLGTLGGGVSHLSGGKFTNYSKKEGLADNFVRAILSDRQGNLWLGTENGLNKMKDGKFVVYTTRNGLSDNSIYSLYEDKEGSLWVGTYGGGLNRLINGKVSAFTMKAGLSQNAVYSIYEDHEGSLWIGTSAGGLNRLKDGKIITFTTNDGLADDLILSVYEDEDGIIWIGTENGGLIQYVNGNFKNYILTDNKASNTVQTILRDKKRDLWFGTEKGLNCMRNGKFIYYTTNEGLSNNSVTSLCEAVDGSLWVGSRDGLNLFKNNKFTVFKTEQGLSDNVIRVILLDRERNLWVGTNNGLNQLQNGVFKIYTTNDGLSNNFIYSLYQDKDGILWIGTRSGLNRLAAGKITSYTVSTGMYDDVVFQILEDEKENLWMSCNKGIYEISKNELNQYALGKIPQIHSLSYGIADGMKSRECCGGLQPSGWKSRDGRLWFPTIKGLTAINPVLRAKKNETPPPVIIEQVWVEGREVKIKQGAAMIFSPGTERFEFHYTALSFLAADKVKFKYQLKGIDRQMEDGGNQRAAYYTNIPPGHYTFKVIACNNDGVWNTNGAIFKFYLKPFFYQTWWFYLICGIGFIFIGLGIHRFRIKQLESKKEELEQLVLQRTEQLANANKELKRLSIVASETDNAVYIMDAQGNLEWINEGCIRMHGMPGVTMEQLIQKIGTNILEASSNPDIKNVFNTSITEKRSVQYESYLINKAGEKKWLHTTLTPIFDDAGNLTKLVAIDSDISKIKAAEKEIKRKNQEISFQKLQLEKANKELELLATIDGLTGIANHRYFMIFFEKEWKRAVRNKKPISIILIDVDFFKLCNDTLGHQQGDECLRRIAQSLSEMVKRPADLVARYGGDEFIVMLSETDSLGVENIAEKMRIGIENLGLVHKRSSVADHLAISLGFATIIPQRNKTSDALIKAADDALYQSKAHGRNCITCGKIPEN